MKLVSGKDGRNGGPMHAKAERSTREAACLLVRLAAMPTASSASESVASRVSRKSPGRSRPPATDKVEKPPDETVEELGAVDAPVEASTSPPSSEEPYAHELAEEPPGLLEAGHDGGSVESPTGELALVQLGASCNGQMAL